MPIPPTLAHEYRETNDLAEVNRLALEDGFELFLAVPLDGRLRYILRRVREPEGVRRVGFSGPPPTPASAPTEPAARDRPTEPRR